jgi:signal transduction histidine kinase
LFADGVLMRLDEPDGSSGGGGGVRGFAKIARDATAQREVEEALRQAHDVLEARVDERTAYLTQALTQLEIAYAQLKQAEAAREELLRRLVTAEEDERRHIARELHDEMGQEITALVLGLKALEAGLPAGEGGGNVERLQQLQVLADRMGRQVHDIALELRPTALDDLGLRAALQNYVEDWSARTNIAADFHSVGLVGGARLPAIVETSAYRVAQEALTNVARHANARRASVILERRDNILILIVEDDGCGFDADVLLDAVNKPAQQQQRRLGLLGMRERAALCGGLLTIESSPNGETGTTVYLRLPLSGLSLGKARDDAPTSAALDEKKDSPDVS